MAKGILRNLRIKRVAVVDMGANFDKKTGDGAHIMLYKSAGPNIGDVHVDRPLGDDDDNETDYEKANLSADQRNSLPDSAFAAVWTDAKGKKRRKLPIHDAGHLAAARGRIDQADIPADVKASARRKIEAASNRKPKEKSVKKNWLTKMLGMAAEPDAAKRAELLAKAAEDMDDDDDDEVTKARKLKEKMDLECAATKKSVDLTEEVIKSVIEKAVAAATAPLQKALDAEISKRDESEVRDILKSFKATPFDLEKDTPVYLAMKKADPVSFERTMTILKAQDAQLSQSALYKDFGVRKGVGEGSAWAQLEAKAEQLISKSSEKISKEAAIEQAMMENPALVAQYRQESM